MGGGPPRTDNPNGIATVRMYDNQQAMLERHSDDDQPIFSIRMLLVKNRE